MVSMQFDSHGIFGFYFEKKELVDCDFFFYIYPMKRRHVFDNEFSPKIASEQYIVFWVKMK